MPEWKRLILVNPPQNLLFDFPCRVSGNMSEKDAQGTLKARQTPAVVQHILFRIAGTGNQFYLSCHCLAQAAMPQAENPHVFHAVEIFIKSG